MTQLPAAIVLGLSPTGLYVARELGNKNVPLLGIDKDIGCASYSKYFKNSLGCWLVKETDKLLDKLIGFAKEQSLKPVLLPTSDYYIEFLIKHFKVLSVHFHLCESYCDTAEVLLDKVRFHRLCVNYNIDVPGVWFINNINDLKGIVNNLSYPCILKPAMIHLIKDFMKGQKVFIANDEQSLVDFLKTSPENSGAWLVQEIIPGPESTITLLAGYASQSNAGQEIFTARKLRQYPPGFGSASTVISEGCEETQAITLQLIKALQFKGIYGAEFKRDPRDQRLKIIEINPRPTLWFYLSHKSAKRVVETLYCDLAGLPLPETGAQINGVVWKYWFKDTYSAWFYRWNKHFIFSKPDLLAGGIHKAHCWPVFSWSDPLPVLGEIFMYLKKAWQRLR